MYLYKMGSWVIKNSKRIAYSIITNAFKEFVHKYYYIVCINTAQNNDL